MTARQPITAKVRWLRQRQRADGSWRIWWEPNAEARAAGMAAIDLDERRLTWSIRQAEKHNREADARLAGHDPAFVADGTRTLDALIATYTVSHKFTRRAEATRRGYASDFRRISAKWGPVPVAAFDKATIYTWYETLYATAPTMAGKLIRSMSVLFSHAERLGWRPENSNPCLRLGLEGARKRSRYASWAEFDALVSAADDMGDQAMACAIVLAVFTAQRQADIIGALVDGFTCTPVQLPGDAHPRDLWVWQLVRSKRANLGVMPLHDEAARRVAAIVQQAGDRAFLLHDSATGAPYSGDLFRKRWAATRKQAARLVPSLTGAAPLQFRDLRRTFGVWARAGGGLRDDIGDVLGNSAAVDPQLGEIYMPASFETAARAVASIQRPAAKQGKTA